MDNSENRERKLTLSRVQIDALRMVAGNRTLGEIVDAMRQKHGIGEKAVDRWLQSAIITLGARTLPEAAEVARAAGLLGGRSEAI
jgi:hypothetical protein